MSWSSLVREGIDLCLKVLQGIRVQVVQTDVVPFVSRLVQPVFQENLETYSMKDILLEWA